MCRRTQVAPLHLDNWKSPIARPGKKRAIVCRLVEGGGDVREFRERKREHDQDCKHDKVLVEGETDIVGYTPSGEVGLTTGQMWKDGSDFLSVEMVRTHDDLEGTMIAVACIVC